MSSAALANGAHAHPTSRAAERAGRVLRAGGLRYPVRLQCSARAAGEKGAALAVADEPFAVVLRRARIGAGIGQRTMARCLGMEQPSISRLECWQEGVSESLIRRWAAVLGYRVELRLVPPEEVSGSEG